MFDDVIELDTRTGAHRKLESQDALRLMEEGNLDGLYAFEGSHSLALYKRAARLVVWLDGQTVELGPHIHAQFKRWPLLRWLTIYESKRNIASVAYRPSLESIRRRFDAYAYPDEELHCFGSLLANAINDPERQERLLGRGLG